MQLVRFLSAGGPRLGLLDNAEVLDLVSAAEDRGLAWLCPLFSDLRLFLGGGEGSRLAAASVAQHSGVPRVALASLRLLAPYHTGSKILAHVVNYYGHDKEAGVKVPEKPFFFIKMPGCVGNPEDPILLQPNSKKLDHEVELVIIIGKTGRNIPESAAYAHVGGYSVMNDVSYRDLQFNEGIDQLNKSYGKNWTQGKGMDFACPVGPIVVLDDEMPRPYPLNIVCRVNGVIRQQSNTEKMIFKVPQLISEASKGTTLYPGDLVATGTCAGGGLGDGQFLKQGDNIECEVERIGILRNFVATAESLSSVRV